jgi:calcium-dependent protein kinase
MDYYEAEEKVDTIMQNIDTDLNGYIDYNEFMMASMDKSKLLTRANLEAAFRLFDTDGSGTITIDEVRHMFGDGNTARSSVWLDLIKQCDGNGDGELDLNEFKTMMFNLL